MSHKSRYSGMGGGGVQAIIVRNEKKFIIVLVGVNKILIFGKEYVNLAWE